MKELSPAFAPIDPLWVPAKQWTGKVTNGAAAGTYEGASEGQNLSTLDFDQTTSESAYYVGLWPAGASQYQATVYWTATAGTGTVAWAISAGTSIDGTTVDSALGSTPDVVDTLTATELLHVAQLAPATPSDYPHQLALVNYSLSRVTASDTLNADARLIGVLFQFR